MDLVDLFLFAQISFLLGSILFRKRLARVFLRFLFQNLPEDGFNDLMSNFFKPEEQLHDGKKVTVLVPTALTVLLLDAALPVILQRGALALKSTFKTDDLPLTIGPDGKPRLDMLMPVAKKIAAGKKVGVEDFLPAIMQQVLPYVEKIAQGLGGIFGGGGAPAGAAQPAAGSPPVFTKGLPKK